MESKIDILILNRNMKTVTDQLVSNLKKLKNVGFCGVIDSGSKESEVSEFTFIRDNSNDVLLERNGRVASDEQEKLWDHRRGTAAPRPFRP